jgi:phosphoglycerol transferase MdoB-like AlkP superfamily enzyme
MKLSFRHYYWRWLKNLSCLFILFAILMSLARLGFAFYFGETKTLLERTRDLQTAFLLGFRYDLMPLAYVNALPFLLFNLGYFLPGKLSIRFIRFVTVLTTCFGYVLIGWLYIFDYGFYSYFQDHINILFFGFFEDDTLALLISISKNYNLYIWGTLLIFLHYGLYKIIQFLFSPFDFDLKAKPFTSKIPLAFFSGLIFLSFAARGNFTRLPLSIEDAYFSDNQFINKVALNGALSFNRALKIRKTYGKDNFDYLKSYGFQDWKQAYQAYTGRVPEKNGLKEALVTRSKANPLTKKYPPHVILVVMESFGSFWNDKNSVKFNILGDLKHHFEEGVLFKNFLPSENGTIGSIVSITTSQVIRPGSRFLSESEYMSTKLHSSGHLPFRKSGYETHFVYGGKLGWRDLGKFLTVQEFQKVWGADEIREAMPELNNFSDDDLGNEWGIFDEYLYAFIDEQLRTATRPQFFLVLTTSNHPPFEYPSSYQPLPLELSAEILGQVTVSEELARKRFLGLQYANQKMADFLSKIKTSSLHENTIVALTGDHSYWIAKGVGVEQEFRRYAVPFFLKIPEKLRPPKIDLKNFGSHEDIYPTLVNLALSDVEYVKLGNDLLNEEGDALNSTGLVANQSGAWHNNRFWRWRDLDRQILEPIEESPELELLKRRGHGLIGLTDAFLKSEKNRMPSGAKNDRQ